jgi:hypothetical protein
MARPRKARVEGEAVDARGMMADASHGPGLSGIVEAFKASHPDQWEQLRLCPLQHGLEAMVEALKA